MCNRYGFQNPIHRLLQLLGEAGLPAGWAQGGTIPNLEPQPQIRPTNTAPVLRPAAAEAPGQGVDLALLRWGLVPFFHKGPLKSWKVLGANARSETVATTASFRGAFKSRRCLVPATCFYEWTGLKGDKTMWRIAPTDGDIMVFAGLWDRAVTEDGVIESYTILTTAAGDDIADYHDRQPVVLDRPHLARWLDLSADVSDLLRAGPAGRLKVERFEPATSLFP